MLKKLVSGDTCTPIYTYAVSPVIGDGWGISKRWKKLVWPHHFIKRRGFGNWNVFNTDTFHWNASTTAERERTCIWCYGWRFALFLLLFYRILELFRQCVGFCSSSFYCNDSWNIRQSLVNFSSLCYLRIILNTSQKQMTANNEK